MGPTSPTAAFKIGEKTRRPAGDVPVRHLHDQLQPRRHPRHQHPVRLHEGRACRSACKSWPPPFEEEKLLRVARMYEAATDWHTRRASLV